MTHRTDHWDELLADALRRPGTHDDNPWTGAAIDDVIDWREWGTASWNARTACDRLGVPLLPFAPALVGPSTGGYATPKGIALNPRVRHKVRVVAHELAHVLFQHPFDMRSIEDWLRAQAAMPIVEFEAEAVALLVTDTLGVGDGGGSRAYLQHYVTQPCAGTLPTSWAPIKTTAARILAAGAGTYLVPAPPPAPPALRIDPVETFAGGIRWHS